MIERARTGKLLPALVAVLCIGAALYACRLDADAQPVALTDEESAAARATARFHEQFGDEPITVLVRGRAADGNLPGILLTEDVDRIRGLEGCLSGNLPAGAKPPAPACAALARSKPIKVVQGPGTFINESARQIAGRFDATRNRRIAQAERAARKLAAAQGLSKAQQNRMARRARQVVIAQFQRDVLRIGLAYGFTGAPAINNPYFVLRLVFEPSLGFETPKARFAYLFPSRRTALIQARPRAGLSSSERKNAIALVRSAVASPVFQLQHADYVVSGEPVLEQAAATRLSDALVPSLVLVIVLVGVALAVLFRSRGRLLPLLAGLGAAALTFGAVSMFGGSLTIAQVAALPVLIALAACLAMLLQLRIAATPVMVVAALVAAVSLLTIRLSPVPAARAFGTDVAGGVVAGVIVMMTVGVALLRVSLPALPAFARERVTRIKDRSAATARRAGPAAGRGARRIARALARTPRPASPARVAQLLRGIRRIPGRIPIPLGGLGRLTVAAVAAVRNAPAFAKRAWARVVAAPVKQPRRVLMIALALAALGWVLDARTDVVTGFGRLAPDDSREARDARTFTNETRQAGEVSVIVRAADLTSPRVISWMTRYQRRILARHAYSSRKPCNSADLCPSLSLTNLFGPTQARSPAQLRSQLRALPRNFAQAVVSADRRTGTIAFLMRAMPVEKQRQVIDDMRSQLDPPAGVEAELGGGPVLAAEAPSDLQSSRRILALAAVMAVLAVLLLTLGSFRAALGPSLVAALATGWSGLVVYVSGIPVNALSAALPAAVVAVIAALGLVLSDRYRLDRVKGFAPDVALARIYRLVRRPLIACAVVTLAGFAALAPSNIRVLRDFGVVGLADLVVVLAAAALVLPAALIWAEQAAPLAVPRTPTEAAGAARKLAAAARVRTASLGRRLRRLPVLVRRARREP